MRSDTERKLGPILCAAAVIAAAAVLLAAVIAFAFFGADESGLAGKAVMALYVLIIAAVIAGVAAALCERLKEIKNGEEKEAQKY